MLQSGSSLPAWLATLLQVGGWLIAAISIYISYRGHRTKTKEASDAKVAKSAGQELLGFTLQDRLDMERRFTKIEERMEAQDEVHDLLEKLMANVLRNAGTKDG